MSGPSRELVVPLKQVPSVSELPWDPKTRTLRRDRGGVMIDPAARGALEAALQLKAAHPARITAVSMGPPAAEAVLREALALGADRGILVTDPRLAGADTFITAEILGRAIRRECPAVDLILCGSRTSDSETGQVGPQLAVTLDLPSVAYVETMALDGGCLSVERLCDGFFEALEVDLPALVTVAIRSFRSRHVPMAGLEAAFSEGEVRTVDAEDLGLAVDFSAGPASPTQIRNVYTPTAAAASVVLRGAPRKIVAELLDRYEDRIGGAAGRDLKGPESGGQDG